MLLSLTRPDPRRDGLAVTILGPFPISENGSGPSMIEQVTTNPLKRRNTNEGSESSPAPTHMLKESVARYTNGGGRRGQGWREELFTAPYPLQPIQVLRQSTGETRLQKTEGLCDPYLSPASIKACPLIYK